MEEPLLEERSEPLLEEPLPEERFCFIVSRLPIAAELFHSSNSIAGRDYVAH